jgi:hypothetical protein
LQAIAKQIVARPNQDRSEKRKQEQLQKQIPPLRCGMTNMGTGGDHSCISAVVKEKQRRTCYCRNMGLISSRTF